MTDILLSFIEIFVTDESGHLINKIEGFADSTGYLLW